MPEDPRQFTHADYTVGWICALPETEFVAAGAILDEEHPLLPATDPQDTNSYLLGKVGDHNVVIACLPAETTGKASAATVAKDMLRSFPAIRFGLLVGIGGGAPYYGALENKNAEHREQDEDSEYDLEDVRDIRLGDVVISLHSKSGEAVVQYDFGKSLQDREFVHTGGRLNKPPQVVLTAVAKLQQQHKRKGHKIPELLMQTLSNNPLMAEEFTYPGLETDRLFKSDVVHREGRKSCKACCGPNNANLVRRPDRSGAIPKIHYGTIGSADQVMKDAVLRDRWAQKENILCFEMEAAGLMDTFPCLVIRGICDYADSHKNKIWQPYAALTAALYAKELLLVIPGQGVMGLAPAKQLVDQLDKIEKNTAETRRVLVSYQKEKLHNKIVSWISTLDYAAKHNDMISRHKPGTGAWLLSCHTFKIWIETPTQTLFCPGIPGAGKTIIASMIINHLQQKFYNKNTGVSYVYCNYNEHHKARDLIACLIKQLLMQLPYLPDQVEEFYQVHEKQNTFPLNDDLLQILQSVTRSFSMVFIVIDAIDEYQDENSRTAFLQYIKKIKTFSNLLVTSRPIASIEEIFKEDLRKDISATNGDIATYVQSEICSRDFILSTELSPGTELHELVVNEIVSKAKGMFLHAQFHVKYLQPKHTIRSLKEALAALPNTSDVIYENAIQRVYGQNAEVVALAINTLQWIVCASRSLRIQEIQHALAVREGDTHITSDALTSPKYILSVCAGLITIDKHSSIIRLVHYTAQEFFKKHQLEYFPTAEATISLTCLRYLSLEEFCKDHRLTDELYNSRISQYPLLEYAARNVGNHLYHVTDQSVIAAAVRFLSDPCKLSCLTQVCFRGRQWTEYSGHFLNSLYGTHFGAYYGLHEIVRQIFMGSDTDINVVDSYGQTPLSWAARNGHEAVVTILLENNATVDSIDDSGQTPLSWAARNGHEAVVTMLLENNAIADSIDDNDQTPLLWAAQNGHEAVVTMLLENNATVDSIDEHGQTPLSWAAESGHEAVVKILLENGAEVDSLDDWGQTPLLLAAQNGHEAVVRMLLEKGADVDLVNTKYGRTPLLWAAKNGHEAVVRMLLKKGAQVDLADTKYGQTPLSLAAENGHKAVVRMLQEHSTQSDMEF